MQKFDRSNYKYIYDVSFANRLIVSGVKCIGTGVSKQTGKYFWCFDYFDCQPIYEEIKKRKLAQSDN